MLPSREPLDESVRDYLLNVIAMQARQVAEYSVTAEQNYTYMEHEFERPEFQTFCDTFNLLYLQERSNLSILRKIIKEDYGVVFSEDEINDRIERPTVYDRVERPIAAADAQ